jgi:hypothetical protein
MFKRNFQLNLKELNKVETTSGRPKQLRRLAPNSAENISYSSGLMGSLKKRQYFLKLVPSGNVVCIVLYCC